MSIFEWCQWLQHTRLATAISESDWLFPLIEGSHILTLPLSVGMIVILDLRLLGLAFCDGPGAKLVLRQFPVGWQPFPYRLRKSGPLSAPDPQTRCDGSLRIWWFPSASASPGVSLS